MLIVGEKINTSTKRMAQAVETGDAALIAKVAREQVAAGADFVDVNAGTFVEKEVDYLPWLVRTVQSSIDIPLCLDSPNPETLAKALQCHKGEAMVNSISLELTIASPLWHCNATRGRLWSIPFLWKKSDFIVFCQ